MRPHGACVTVVDLAPSIDYAQTHRKRCPRCGYEWIYRGKFISIGCSVCGYKKTEKEYTALYVQKFRKLQTSKGICQTGCGRIMATTTRCRACCDKENVKMRIIQREHVNKGFCQSGCGRPLKNKNLCAICMNKANARQQTPEHKAYMKAYNKAYSQTPEHKASANARQQTPEHKAYQKAYKQTPEYKAYQKAYREAHRKPLNNKEVLKKI